MYAVDSLKIISVTGAHSKVGKTTLCSILLKELKGLGAIKFTKTSLYPVRKKTSFFERIKKPVKNIFGLRRRSETTPEFSNGVYTSLIEDINILNQRGKDTALFLESGAERVIWIQSPHNELKNVLEIAISKMVDLKGVIVEGNSPVDFLNPHLVIFITEPKGRFKPSAIKVGEKADIVIINSKKQTKEPGFLTPIIQKNTKVFWIDLRERKGELEELLSFVKEKISRDAH